MTVIQHLSKLTQDSKCTGLKLSNHYNVMEELLTNNCYEPKTMKISQDVICILGDCQEKLNLILQENILATR